MKVYKKIVKPSKKVTKKQVKKQAPKVQMKLLGDSYLKKTLKVDAHKLKYDYLGKKANIKLYDLYQRDGYIWIYLKKGKKAICKTHIKIK